MDKALLYPLLFQIFWTFLIGLLTFKVRISATKAGQVSLSYFKHNSGKAPELMKRFGDNFSNQFETPVLFYVLIMMLLITQLQGGVYTFLAWVYVVSRIVHSWVHIKTNVIQHRLMAYFVGVFALMIMWGRLVFDLLGG